MSKTANRNKGVNISNLIINDNNFFFLNIYKTFSIPTYTYKI